MQIPLLNYCTHGDSKTEELPEGVGAGAEMAGADEGAEEKEEVVGREAGAAVAELAVSKGSWSSIGVAKVWMYALVF